jgi:hypothetical protein
MEEMNSGIYIRVDNKNVLIEDLTKFERNAYLETYEKESLLRLTNVLLDVIKEFENNILNKEV